MLLLSVAPLVKMISFAFAPIAFATSARAASIASSAYQPYMCVRECGLPYCSTR